jgi:hypothetical protein
VRKGAGAVARDAGWKHAAWRAEYADHLVMIHTLARERGEGGWERRMCFMSMCLYYV